MKIKIPVGDWSGDGHGRSKDIIIGSNTPVEVLQQGYKDSCKLTGLQFNENEDYTGLGLKWDHPEFGDRRIAVEYQSSTVSKLAEKVLLEHGIDVWEGFDMNEFTPDDMVYIDGPTHFVQILLRFIKLSVPEFEYTIMEKDTIPTLNGYWNDMNVQFGYGLFDQ